MTYSKDREPLLRQGGHEKDTFQQILTMSAVYYANPSLIYSTKRERMIPKTVFLVISLVLVLFLVDQYRVSMRKALSQECNDPLAECDGIPFNRTVLPPFYDYLQDFTVSPRYGMSLCLIPKVMSTIGTAILCYLDDPKAFSNSNRSISTEMYDSRFCEQNEMKSFSMVQHKLRRNLDNLIVVRDPFDRFISGFVEKCIQSASLNLCHDCGTDVRCFLRKEYRRLMRMAMLFPVYTTADTHFAPQTWFCDMKNTLEQSTVIKYANHGKEKDVMIGDILKVLQRNNVSSEDMEEVKLELSKGKTKHSTSGSHLRKELETLVREDESIRRALIRMYYHDFVYFGYDM